jgi:hypothetical protein
MMGGKAQTIAVHLDNRRVHTMLVPRAVRFTIPGSLLARADEVIE